MVAVAWGAGEFQARKSLGKVWRIFAAHSAKNEVNILIQEKRSSRLTISIDDDDDDDSMA